GPVMPVLFDQATPYLFVHFSPAIPPAPPRMRDGDKLQNGDLLNAAEAAGFEVFLTTDKNIRHQQNLTGRKIAIVLIRKQQWPDLKPHVQLVVAAVNAATPGSYVEVEIP
ncbi:MAG: hypothetical protein WA324_19145, partial [Bryobacteraceae bacterium]